jgi:hypothetical protein
MPQSIFAMTPSQLRSKVAMTFAGVSGSHDGTQNRASAVDDCRSLCAGNDNMFVDVRAVLLTRITQSVFCFSIEPTASLSGASAELDAGANNSFAQQPTLVF